MHPTALSDFARNRERIEMNKEEIKELRQLFYEAGYLVGEVMQRDIMFKYTVPIDVERVKSLTIASAHNSKLVVGVLNPSGVAYTYRFVQGIEDEITEVPYDGTVQDLFKKLQEAIR
ncbi:hypothetical protein C5L33_000282 [Lactobacillus pasteurii]|nr:hypothetical protein C5L33_000282 [Lactobacillus pasteurii]